MASVDPIETNIHVVGTGIYSGFKPFFNEKYNPNEGSIDSHLYVYKSAMEEATNCQKVKHLLS